MSQPGSDLDIPRPDFLDMHDQPMSLSAWAALYEDIQARTLHCEPVDEHTEIALIWVGENLPEIGQLPWGLVIRARGGRFIKEIAQFANRASAEAGWQAQLATLGFGKETGEHSGAR